MTAHELIDSLRPANPNRRFAITRSPYSGDVSAVAIDNPSGGWDMFAAAYIPDKWVYCLIPMIQERNDWQEVTA